MVTTIAIIGNKHPYSISSKKNTLIYCIVFCWVYITQHSITWSYIVLYIQVLASEFTIWINFLWLASINVKDIRLLSFLSFDCGPLYYKVEYCGPRVTTFRHFGHLYRCLFCNLEDLINVCNSRDKIG